jgi:hypothetical protein
MAQKISINQRFSETPSDSLSFKNKRRRKVHSSSSTLETDKSQLCRLENGRQETISDVRCMTNTRECFQQQFSPDNTSHACESAGKCDEGVDRAIIEAKSSSDGPTVAKSMPLRDIVNCRKLLDWATASSVRKLLPIFILVNMLPFLYAGESSLMYFCMPICSSSRCQLP